MQLFSKEENLKREIGVRSLSLSILNITVGSGIFVLPAIIAENLGTSAILAYLVCGVLIFLIALCFAEVGSITILSGGVYTYIENAFGSYAGFLANNLYWLGSCVISDAAIANALADTLKYFFPFLGIEIFRILFFLFVFAGLAIINIRSVKNGVRFVEFAAISKIMFLILLIISSFSFVEIENLKWGTTPTINNIGTTSLLLFYAFMGFEAPLSNGGEIKNPKRTVPLGVFIGISCVLILYISIQLISQGVLGNTITNYKAAPLAAIANLIFGKVGIMIIIFATAISMIGGIAGEILSIPRILFAGARKGIMPKAMANVHPLFFTPHIAIITYATIGFLFSIFGGFKQLAIISSAASLIIYLGIVLATVKLRKKHLNNKEKTFKTPGGIAIPILTICAIVWLLSNLTKPEFFGIALFISVLSLIYLGIKLFKEKINV